MSTISMSELHEALRAKGYEATREPGFSIVIKLGEGHEVIVGGDEYEDDQANPDNLSWWREDNEEEEEEVILGGYYDPEEWEEGLPFTVETVAGLVADFIDNN